MEFLASKELLCFFRTEDLKIIRFRRKHIFRKPNLKGKRKKNSFEETFVLQIKTTFALFVALFTKINREKEVHLK